MGNIVKHGGWDISAAEEALAEAAKGGGGDRLKLKPGTNVVRFMPPPAGRNQALAVIYQHWITTAEGNRQPINCPRLMGKQRCACCEKMDSLSRTGNAADFDAAQAWKAKLSVAANVIDRDDEAKGPQLLNFGKTILDALVAIRKDARGGGDFTDPEDGFDIVIEKTGVDKNTKYAVRPARNTTPLHDDPGVAADWLDNQIDLDRLKTLLPYEEQLALLGADAPRQTRELGRVNAAGQRKPEVLTPPPAAGQQRRRSVADDTEDVPF